MRGQDSNLFRAKALPLLALLQCPNNCSLGAWQLFDRCAITAFAFSPTGSARLLCSGNPPVVSSCFAHNNEKADTISVSAFFVVAGTRLELATSGLWARRATNCSTPRYMCLLNLYRVLYHIILKCQYIFWLFYKTKTGSLSVRLNYPSSLFNKNNLFVLWSCWQTQHFSAITITLPHISGCIYSTTASKNCQDILWKIIIL